MSQCSMLYLPDRLLFSNSVLRVWEVCGKMVYMNAYTLLLKLPPIQTLQILATVSVTV